MVKRDGKAVWSGNSHVLVNSTTNATNGTFILSLSVPQDGAYNITATAYDKAGNSATHTVNITVDTAKPNITIDVPTESAPVYRKGGEQFYVNFTYTAEHPKNYTVKAYNSSAVINASSGDYPAGGENKVLNVSFHLNASAADGKYNVSVEMYNNASNYNISYQNESVVKVAAPPTLNCTCGDICVNTTGWWRADAAFNASNTPIQHAINNATEGNTICVKDGTYNENVDVDRRLTIRSKNGSALTTVEAASTSDHVFNVSVDYVNISGFKMTGATGGEKAGIYLDSNVGHCNISDNNVSSNYFGIYLSYSCNNNLTNNTMSRNAYNFSLSGNADSHFNNTIDMTNSVDGKPIYYIKDNSSGMIIDSTSNAGTIYCIRCDNVTIKDLNLTKNWYGVCFWKTTNSSIENVTASTNYEGIYLSSSCNNLTSNTANSNTNYGIFLYSSSNYNTLTNNTANSNNNYGICLVGGVSHNSIEGGNVSHNSGGISIVFFRNPRRFAPIYNSITGVTITHNNNDGIRLQRGADYCTIANNIIRDNIGYGIHLEWSNHNTLTNNTASNNTNYDFYSDQNSHNNTVKDFTIASIASIASYPTTISFSYDQGIKIKGVTTPEPDPAGKGNISKYVNATNVTANSWLFLNVSYSDAEVIGVDEASLKMYRHNGTGWELADGSGVNGVNQAANYVYANITEFSVFALLGNVTGPTLELGNVSNITEHWGRDFNLNHSVTVTNANASNVNVTYNVSWLTTQSLGTVKRSETKWANQTVSNSTVQNVTVRANANSTTVSAINDTEPFWINLTKRDIVIVVNPEATQTVHPGETLWINGSAKDEYGSELIGKADLLREGIIVGTQDINISSGNANFSRTEPSAGAFNFSIRFYNLTHYNNATTSNSSVTVVIPVNITSFAPPSPVSDTEGATLTFNITINQTVNVSWQINGTEVQTNESVTEASYTNTSAAIGTWNVSAIVNNTNGTDMQTWTWTVEAAPSPCYIATATYGTPLDENIDVLRDFRDTVLMTNPVGEAFVSAYYTTSPPIADALRENDGLRTVTRLTLITPLVSLSKLALNDIWLVLIIGLTVTAVLSLRKDRKKILKPLLAGVGAILVFIAAIFSLGFTGYTIPLCAVVGAYMLPFVIPLSVVFTLCTVLKLRINMSHNINVHA